MSIGGGGGGEDAERRVEWNMCAMSHKIKRVTASDVDTQTPGVQRCQGPRLLFLLLRAQNNISRKRETTNVKFVPVRHLQHLFQIHQVTRLALATDSPV